MVPLSRQTDFFVPEMKEEVKTDVKEEDSDEDRGTDITGNLLLLLSPHHKFMDSVSQKALLFKVIHNMKEVLICFPEEKKSLKSRFLTWQLISVVFCYVL